MSRDPNVTGMTWPLPDRADLRPTFLVERYISPDAAVELAASSARLARLCANPALTAPRVSYQYSAYLPTEDTCFCLFRAASVDAVRALNDQADFGLDRIIAAVRLL